MPHVPEHIHSLPVHGAAQVDPGLVNALLTVGIAYIAFALIVAVIGVLVFLFALSRMRR